MFIVLLVFVVARFNTRTKTDNSGGTPPENSGEATTLMKRAVNTEPVADSTRKTSDKNLFNNIFHRREEARAKGDVTVFNGTISKQSLANEMKFRAGNSDADFAVGLINGYKKMSNPDITKLPLVDFQPGATTTLLIYEGPVLIKEGDERIVTRLVEFVFEDGGWKINRDHIDYRGIKPREIPDRLGISATPTEQ